MPDQWKNKLYFGDNLNVSEILKLENVVYLWIIIYST